MDPPPAGGAISCPHDPATDKWKKMDGWMDGITESNSNQCKETNTFILAGTNEVKKVCRDAGAPYQNQRDMRVSLQPFHVVNCDLRSNNRYPRCEYRGRSSTRYIVISCEQDYPVHFQGFAN
uniref:Ribonuclease A-domain domain-containing protein n=1 Tax=Neogobius melanostomus TaxID=47308 RepID=A0A8C6TS56_9GOBI